MEEREEGDVRVLAETMPKFGKLSALFVAISLVSSFFSTEPRFGRNTSPMPPAYTKPKPALLGE